MKHKLLLILMCVSTVVCAQQSSGLPNYLLAGQISVMVTKLGMPVDSVAGYLTVMGQFEKTRQTATDIYYGCTAYDSVFDIKKNDAGLVTLIICEMPVTMLSTAQKAIVLMGMTATGTGAPPGFTAYATPKYAAFLNPEQRKGYLGLVLVPGS